MKIINITHNDLDGIGSPIVLSYFFPRDTIEVYSVNYRELDETVEKSLNSLEDVDRVYITDIAFRESTGFAQRIEKLNRERGEDFIKLFDHHASSYYLNKYSWASSKELDEDGKETCGTKWLYKHLSDLYPESYNPVLKQFVEDVNLYDTWRWVNDFPKDKPFTEARNLDLLLSMRGKKDFFETFSERIRNWKPLFSETDKEILAIKEEEVARDVKKKEEEMVVKTIEYRTKKKDLPYIEKYLKGAPTKISSRSYLLDPNYKTTFKAGIVFASRNISEVGNEIAKRNPELDLVILINLPNSISYRSVKELDVPLGIFAKYLTGVGGGHPQSAGGSINARSLGRILDCIVEE